MIQDEIVVMSVLLITSILVLLIYFGYTTLPFFAAVPIVYSLLRLRELGQYLETIPQGTDDKPGGS
jgi:hypothetical protein